MILSTFSTGANEGDLLNSKLGNKTRRRLNLLDRQPLCIFCGGAAPASTGDHQPARSFFDAKHAPEGYEFPACEPCNKKSRRPEDFNDSLVDSSLPGKNYAFRNHRQREDAGAELCG
jgi:hypothetical protein